MSPRHVLLCYASPYDDGVLGQVAELCRASRASLNVVLPVLDVAAADGCCGIQGDHWQRIMGEADHEARLRALDLLDQLGCPPQQIDVEVGHSLPEIAQRAAERGGCDAIAVGRRRWPWSSGLTRRQLTKLRAQATVDVLELPPRATRIG
jgi:nucleotide-binding universal stress UspA family protein